MEIDKLIEKLKIQTNLVWETIQEIQTEGMEVRIEFHKTSMMLKPSLEIYKKVFSEKDFFKPLLSEKLKDMILF